MTADLEVRPVSGERLLEVWSALAWRVIRDYDLRPHELEDAWQATAEKVLRHAGSLRDPHSAAPWVATIARRECVRLLAQERRYVPAGDMLAFDRAEPGPAVDEALLRAERAAEVRAAVATLNARSRLLMSRLWADEPRTYAQVSAATGIPVGAIGPMRGRSLATLRTALAGPRPARRPRHTAAPARSGPRRPPAPVRPGDPFTHLWGIGWSPAATQVIGCLQRDGVVTVADLMGRDARDLRDLRSFGVACLAEVRHVLRDQGLALRGEEVASGG